MSYSPHSLEAERSVLGGLMLDPDTLSSVVDIVSADDFYHVHHRLIFEAILSLFNQRRAFDLTSLNDALSVGGKREVSSSYVAEILSDTPSAAFITHHAAIVRDHALARKLIAAGQEVVQQAQSNDPIEERIQRAEESVYKVANREYQNQCQSLDVLTQASILEITKLIEAKEEITGLRTGWTDLDRRLLGFQKSDLIILAARPAIGKTSLALQFAFHIAEHGTPTVFFSLEMSAGQLVRRLLASEGRIDSQHLRNGRLEEREIPKLSIAEGKLRNTPLYIDDSAGLTPAILRSRVRRLQRERNVQFVVIDYLQLMDWGKESRNENRVQEVTYISRQLKKLAKELNIPIVALSQLNRSLESRADKRPLLSDLRESGSIEQEADIVLLLYRDEVYNPTTQEPNTAEIDIAKHRNGPTGTIKLTFLPQFTRFENRMGEEREDMRDEFDRA